MGKAERDWNKFKRNVLEKTDVLKDSNFDKIFKDAKKDFEDLFSYFEVHGSVGSIQTLTAQLNATREQIEQIDKTGTSAIYGDNKYHGRGAGSGICLWAYELTIQHPTTKEMLTFNTLPKGNKIWKNYIKE